MKLSSIKGTYRRAKIKREWPPVCGFTACSREEMTPRKNVSKHRYEKKWNRIKKTGLKLDHKVKRLNISVAFAFPGTKVSLQIFGQLYLEIARKFSKSLMARNDKKRQFLFLESKQKLKRKCNRKLDDKW